MRVQRWIRIGATGSQYIAGMEDNPGQDNPRQASKDVELLLRVFALSQYREQYEKPMKEFLNVAMERNRTGATAAVKQFSGKFSDAVALVVKHLGAKPFHIRGPLNTAAMDSVLCTVIGNIDRVPPDLDKRYAALKEDATFQNATFYGTSDVATVDARFEAADTYLFS